MRHLSPKEFYLLLAQQVGVVKDSRAKEWCDSLIEIIGKELFYKHQCRIPGMGVFELYLQEEYIQPQIRNGVEYNFVVPERYLIRFTPSDKFLNDVNGKGVTRSYRYREKTNKLTARDIERQLEFTKEKEKEYFNKQAEISKAIKEESQQKRKETLKKKATKKPNYKRKKGGGGNEQES